MPLRRSGSFPPRLGSTTICVIVETLALHTNGVEGVLADPYNDSITPGKISEAWEGNMSQTE